MNALEVEEEDAWRVKANVQAQVIVTRRFGLQADAATNEVNAAMRSALQLALCSAPVKAGSSSSDAGYCEVKQQGGVPSPAPDECAAFDGPTTHTELYGEFQLPGAIHATALGGEAGVAACCTECKAQSR